MKPEPLYVFRDSKKEKDEEDAEGAEDSRPASSQKNEGEESKDVSQKLDQNFSDSKSLMGDSENEEAEKKAEEKRK